MRCADCPALADVPGAAFFGLHGWSHRRVADALGVHPAQVSRWLRPGGRIPARRKHDLLDLKRSIIFGG